MEQLFSRIEVLPDLAAARLLEAISYDDVEEFCRVGSIFEIRFCGDSEDNYNPAIHRQFKPTSTMFRLFFQRDFGISKESSECVIGHDKLKQQVARSFETHFPSVGNKYYDLRIIRKMQETYLYMRKMTQFEVSIKLRFQTPNQTQRVVQISCQPNFAAGIVCVRFASETISTQEKIRGFCFVPLLDVLLDPTQETLTIRVPRRIELEGFHSAFDDDFLGWTCAPRDDVSLRQKDAMRFIQQLGRASVGFSEDGEFRGFMMDDDLTQGLLVHSLTDNRDLYGYGNSWLASHPAVFLETEKMKRRTDAATLATNISPERGVAFNLSHENKTRLDFGEQNVQIFGDYEFFVIFHRVGLTVRCFVSYRTIPPSVKIGETTTDFLEMFSNTANNVPGIYRSEREMPDDIDLLEYGFNVQRVDQDGGNFALVILWWIPIERGGNGQSRQLVELVEFSPTNDGTIRLHRTASIKIPTDYQADISCGIRSVGLTFSDVMIRFDFNSNTAKTVVLKQPRGNARNFLDRYLGNYFALIRPSEIKQINVRPIRRIQ